MKYRLKYRILTELQILVRDQAGYTDLVLSFYHFGSNFISVGPGSPSAKSKIPKGIVEYGTHTRSNACKMLVALGVSRQEAKKWCMLRETEKAITPLKTKGRVSWAKQKKHFRPGTGRYANSTTSL